MCATVTNRKTNLNDSIQKYIDSICLLRSNSIPTVCGSDVNCLIECCNNLDSLSAGINSIRRGIQLMQSYKHSRYSVLFPSIHKADKYLLYRLVHWLVSHNRWDRKQMQKSNMMHIFACIPNLGITMYGEDNNKPWRCYTIFASFSDIKASLIVNHTPKVKRIFNIRNEGSNSLTPFGIGCNSSRMVHPNTAKYTDSNCGHTYVTLKMNDKSDSSAGVCSVIDITSSDFVYTHGKMYKLLNQSVTGYHYAMRKFAQRHINNAIFDKYQAGLQLKRMNTPSHLSGHQLMLMVIAEVVRCIEVDLVSKSKSNSRKSSSTPLTTSKDVSDDEIIHNPDLESCILWYLNRLCPSVDVYPDGPDRDDNGGDNNIHCMRDKWLHGWLNTSLCRRLDRSAYICLCGFTKWKARACQDIDYNLLPICDRGTVDMSDIDEKPDTMQRRYLHALSRMTRDNMKIGTQPINNVPHTNFTVHLQRLLYGNDIVSEFEKLFLKNIVLYARCEALLIVSNDVDVDDGNIDSQNHDSDHDIQLSRAVRSCTIPPISSSSSSSSPIISTTSNGNSTTSTNTLNCSATSSHGNDNHRRSGDMESSHRIGCNSVQVHSNNGINTNMIKSSDNARTSGKVSVVLGAGHNEVSTMSSCCSLTDRESFITVSGTVSEVVLNTWSLDRLKYELLRGGYFVKYETLRLFLDTYGSDETRDRDVHILVGRGLDELQMEDTVRRGIVIKCGEYHIDRIGEYTFITSIGDMRTIFSNCKLMGDVLTMETFGRDTDLDVLCSVTSCLLCIYLDDNEVSLSISNKHMVGRWIVVTPIICPLHPLTSIIGSISRM